MDVHSMVGVDPSSGGLARARSLGVEASSDGVEWLLSRPVMPDLIFEATSAKAHEVNAPAYAAAGITAIDLTPAAIGPLVCPVVNIDEHVDARNINMITCGGQATVPVVAAITSVTAVAYAEIVATISSNSAGPGTRANIDEFTEVTSRAIEIVGGARRGKAIILLNPVQPNMIMRNTVFCSLQPDADREAIAEAIRVRVAEVQQYVPGYRLRSEPQFDEPTELWSGMGRVGVFLEVTGNGDYLPPWAGNLDIMTAAAVRVGELVNATRNST